MIFFYKKILLQKEKEKKMEDQNLDKLINKSGEFS